MRPYAFVLAVQNLAVSTAYFQDVLGFKIDWADGDEWRLLARGETRFMLGHCPAMPPARDIGDHSYIAYVSVDDVDALHTEFAARGAMILQPPADKAWGIREMLLATPDGHRMMLGQTITPR